MLRDFLGVKMVSQSACISAILTSAWSDHRREAAIARAALHLTIENALVTAARGNVPIGSAAVPPSALANVATVRIFIDEYSREIPRGCSSDLDTFQPSAKENNE